MAGGFIDRKKRLPSPLPKPSAHGIAYDATGRCIEFERAQVRLRQRQTHVKKSTIDGIKYLVVTNRNRLGFLVSF